MQIYKKLKYMQIEGGSRRMRRKVYRKGERMRENNMVFIQRFEKGHSESKQNGCALCYSSEKHG